MKQVKKINNRVGQKIIEMVNNSTISVCSLRSQRSSRSLYVSCIFLILRIFAVTERVGADQPPYNVQAEITGEVSSNSAVIHTRLTLHPERNRTTKTWKIKEDEWLPYSTDLTEEVVGREGWVRILICKDSLMRVVRKTNWKHAIQERDFTAQFPINDLKPATQYYYRAEMSSEKQHNLSRYGLIHSFKTASVEDKFSPVEFTVVTSTSADGRDIKKEGIPWGFQSFLSMISIKPDFFVHTGDNVYYDTDSPLATDRDLARYHWHRIHSIQCVMDLFRTVPVYFMKDDHDYRWDDCYPQQEVPHDFKAGTSYITDKIGREVFLEAVPMSEKTYRTFVWGKGLQIWLVEGRDFRSPNTMPDGPDKTIWGKEQKQWLKNELLKSKSIFKILISPTPIVGPDRETKIDNHANTRGFKTEGREFLNWVASSEIKNFYIICGDRHWQYHSIDSTGVEEFSCGCTSALKAAVNQPRWEKDRQPYFREGQGGFLHIKLSGIQENPELRIIFRDVDGTPLYVVRKMSE